LIIGRIKNLLGQLIPPLLIKGIRRTVSKSPSYKSFEEALADCQNDGYQEKNIINNVLAKNFHFREQIASGPSFELASLRTIIGLALATSNKSLKVLDFGGGGGADYSIARIAFDSDIKLKWNVVETPAMVSKTKALENEELKFFDSVFSASEDLEEVDIILTSGSLQYCPDPILILKNLLSVNAKYLFITRSAFNQGEAVLFGIQDTLLSKHGPGPVPDQFIEETVSLPTVFAPKRTVENLIHEKYIVRFQIMEERGAYKVGNKSIDMYGYFCVRRD